uniref:SH2 domain-containing protein n=1 Tax=Scylla olivacea TaxID=85551 RepID=A0A0P4VVN2_SCYOL
MARVEAEQILMSRLNSAGAFLIRQSHRNNDFVLSVKLYAEDGYTPCIKHYNICQSQDNYLTLGGQRFLSLQDLVNNFINTDPGSCRIMPKHPCVRPPPTMQDISKKNKDQWEMPREELHFVREIGHGSFGEVWLGRCKIVNFQ